MNIEIRKPKVNEAKALIQARLKALKEYPTAFGSDYEETLKDGVEKWQTRIQNSLEEKGQITMCAFDGELIAGISILIWKNTKKMKHVAHLVGVQVDSNYHGQGIATSIFDNLKEAVMKKNQFKKIRTEVTKTNISAIKLYKQLGFVEVGTWKDELYVDDKYYDLVELELYLD